MGRTPSEFVRVTQMPAVMYSPPLSLAAICGCCGLSTTVCQHSVWPSGHSERGSQEKRRGISVLCDTQMSRFSFQDGLLPPALECCGQVVVSSLGTAPPKVTPLSNDCTCGHLQAILPQLGGTLKGHSGSRAPRGVRQAVTGLPHTSTSFSAHRFVSPSFHRY